MTRNIVDAQGNILGTLNLPEGTSEEVWQQKLAEYLPKPPVVLTPAEYIQQVVIPDAKKFVKELETDFITYNIANGISASGKTGAVLALLTKQVLLEGQTETLSITDTLYSECPSLTVTIDILNWHIENSLELGLEPFVTFERLRALKNKIETYLHKPLT